MNLKVLRTKMTLCCKQHLNVLRGRTEDRGKIGGSHDGRVVDGDANGKEVWTPSVLCLELRSCKKEVEFDQEQADCSVRSHEALN